ncbi:MAG TPA: hypothetical protein VMT96_00465 [Candidatus Bathyarchaeia archaeon]|nr:hypothetical protein [Candidatus Bathyarchaeia archaeon]
MNFFQQRKERLARARTASRVIERLHPEGIPDTHGTLLRAALLGLEGSEWFFPAQKSFKMQLDEAREILDRMDESLGRMRTHLTDLALQAAALRQFQDESPEAFERYPEEVRQRIEDWSNLLILDEDNPNFRNYLDCLDRRNAESE